MILQCKSQVIVFLFAACFIFSFSSKISIAQNHEAKMKLSLGPNSSSFIQLPIQDFALAEILPLPGKFKSHLANSANNGIIIQPGYDFTKDILPSKQIPDKNSDVIYDPTEKIIASKEDIPIHLVVKYRNNNINDSYVTDESDFVGFLKKGVTYRVKEGMFTINIIDSSSKKVAEKLDYVFSSNATITWDKEKNRPEWRGFTCKRNKF